MLAGIFLVLFLVALIYVIVANWINERNNQDSDRY